MIKNLILLFISLFITVVVLDTITRHPYISLRFFNTPGSYYSARFPEIKRTNRYLKNVMIEADVTGNLAWIMGNNTKKRRILFKTDDRGLRNYTNKPEKPIDLIILADSFGTAEVINQDKILSEQLNDKGYSAYNMSIDGADLWLEFVTLNYETPKLRLANNVQVVWLLFEGNDLEEGRFGYEVDLEKIVSTKTEAILKSMEMYYKRSIIRIALKRLFLSDESEDPERRVLKRKIFNKEMLFYNYEPYLKTLNMTLEDIYNHKNYSRIKALFNDMKKFIDDKDFDLICIVIPTKPRVYEWVLNEKKPWSSDISQSAFSIFIQDLCRGNNIPFVDLTPDFITKSKSLYEKDKKMIYDLDDTHWSEEGISIAASKIDRFLKKKEY